LLALLTLAGCGDAAPAGVGTTPQAFAQLRDVLGPWQPSPFVPDPQLVAAADATCRAFHRGSLGSLVVVDVRGGGVVEAFYAEGQRDFFECTQMRVSETGQVTADQGGGSGGDPRPAPAAFELMHLGGGHSTGPNGEPRAATTFGRAGAGIARVQIQVAGQPPIVATLVNGWFAAWWPGGPRATTLGFDGGGGIVARLPLE
jgi:hypothetical protein